MPQPTALPKQAGYKWREIASNRLNVGGKRFERESAEEIVGQRAYGTSAVGNGVFRLGAHLGKSESWRFAGHKHRVLTESGRSVWRSTDVAFDRALEKFYATIGKSECHHGDKPGRTVVEPNHTVEQELHIGLGIMAGACIAGRSHTRLATETIYYQTGIVGNTFEAILILDIAGLDLGIAGKSVGRLGDIVVATYIGQPFHIEAMAYYRLYFGEFVLIVGGHYKHRLAIGRTER